MRYAGCFFYCVLAHFFSDKKGENLHEHIDICSVANPIYHTYACEFLRQSFFFCFLGLRKSKISNIKI